MPVHRYAPLLCAAFFLLFVIAATQTFAGEQLNADQPLAGTKSGDAKAGKNVFIHRKKGNCLACHVVTSLDYIPRSRQNPKLLGRYDAEII